MPERERRQIKRLDASIPITIKFVERTPYPPPVVVETDDISRRGLSISIKIRTTFEHGRLSIQEGGEARKMVQYLLLDNKRLRLGINILPKGRSIQAIGKVKWYDRTLYGDFYKVRAGILIEWMESKHKEEWSEYLRAIYEFMIGLNN